MLCHGSPPPALVVAASGVTHVSTSYRGSRTLCPAHRCYSSSQSTPSPRILPESAFYGGVQACFSSTSWRKPNHRLQFTWGRTPKAPIGPPIPDEASPDRATNGSEDRCREPQNLGQHGATIKRGWGFQGCWRWRSKQALCTGLGFREEERLRQYRIQREDEDIRAILFISVYSLRYHRPGRNK